VSMRFATEVRLMTSHLLRELAESATITVRYPKPTSHDEAAFTSLKLWMREEISKLNAKAVRDEFRAFRAERVCSAADFGVDRTRDPTKPAGTAFEVIQKRGEVLGEDEETARSVLPDAPELDDMVRRYRADFADFCLHKLSSQTGASALALLTSKCRTTPWYTRPSQKTPLVFWDGSRLAYVCVLHDDWSPQQPLAFTSVTQCLIYLVRRGELKLETAIPGTTEMVDITRMKPFLRM